MKNRIAALMLALLMAVSVLSVSVQATDETLFERYIPS